MNRISYATIHHHRRAALITISIGHKKSGELCDFSESADAAQGTMTQVIVTFVIRKISSDTIFKQAGREAKDTDFMPSHFLGQRFGESFYRGFAGVVVNRGFNHPYTRQ